MMVLCALPTIIRRYKSESVIGVSGGLNKSKDCGGSSIGKVMDSIKEDESVDDDFKYHFGNANLKTLVVDSPEYLGAESVGKEVYNALQYLGTNTTLCHIGSARLHFRAANCQVSKLRDCGYEVKYIDDMTVSVLGQYRHNSGAD